MTPDNVEYLPIWKRDATPEERLLEVAMIARKHPDRFNKLVIVYQEELENKRTILRFVSNNCNTDEFVGILHIAIVDKIMEMKG